MKREKSFKVLKGVLPPFFALFFLLPVFVSSTIYDAAAACSQFPIFLKEERI
jgi:hypothetical protein